MGIISAVIITKNEKENIGRCLNSLENIVDEIIVVDAYSTDNTKQICLKYKVKFIKQKFIDYSKSKNFGNKLAKYPFILSIDADEELSEKLQASLLQVKYNLKEDGYSFNRRTNYCGYWVKHCGWYPDKKLRLFRKSKALWKGKIHETLELSSNNTKHLKGDLYHYSYPSIMTHARKINLYAEKGAIELFENNKKASTLKILVAPLFEFIKKYFLKKGFLDGYYGYVISIMSSYNKFYKYAKLKELWNKHNALIN